MALDNSCDISEIVAYLDLIGGDMLGFLDQFCFSYEFSGSWYSDVGNVHIKSYDAGRLPV